jgi:hypothetical protein
MGDLPGPEKPLDWVALLKTEMSPNTPSRPLREIKVLSRVRPRHRIAVMLQEAGWKNKDIAAALGYTESRLSVILNSHNTGLQTLRANFASEVADQVKDVHARFMLYSNEMLDVLVGHARNATSRPELSRLAARDILHMAGFSPVKKVFSVDAKVPTAELNKAMQEISDANEVVLSSDKWRVKETA